MTPDSDAARPRRRRRIAVVAGVVVGLVVVGAWMGVGLRSTAADVDREASAARADLGRAKDAIARGDSAAARVAVADAQTHAQTAADATQTLQLAVLRRTPIASQAVDDLDLLVSAAQDLTAASSSIVDVLAAASGVTGQGLFSDRRADFAAIGATSASVDNAVMLAERARGALDNVSGELPGTGRLAAARDSALSELAPLLSTLTSTQAVLDRLPDALGQNGVRRYLIVTLNPAELYPGGGAALSATVLQFRAGEMSIPVSGAVSTSLFPKNPAVPWQHVPGNAFFQGTTPVGFAWSDLDPDFTVTGEEMMRSWQAHGQEPVDGIIALDPVAISAALKATGPVTVDGYGKVTSSNLVQKLLVDSYLAFRDDERSRHKANDQLVSAMLGRLMSGDGILPVARQLVSTSPTGHFRVALRDVELQRQVIAAGLGGQLSSGERGDGIAVFTQNQNASKVDIFQRRTVDHEVTLSPDGSADVVTRIAAHYDVPASARTSQARRGYLTPWSFAWYIGFVPARATLVSFSAPQIDANDVDDPAIRRSGAGWSVVRLARWTSPGNTTTATLRYRFPAGTFGSAGRLSYSLVTMPQPLLNAAALTIRIDGPGTPSVVSDLAAQWVTKAGSATWSGPLAAPSQTRIDWN